MIRSQIGEPFKINCFSVLDKESSGIQEVFAFWEWFGEPFDFSVCNFLNFLNIEIKFLYLYHD